MKKSLVIKLEIVDGEVEVDPKKDYMVFFGVFNTEESAKAVRQVVMGDLNKHFLGEWIRPERKEDD